MFASDCDISGIEGGRTRLRAGETARGPRLAPPRRPFRCRSTVGVDLAGAGGVALRRAALGLGGLRALLGLAGETLGLGLQLVGAVVPALGLGAAGARLDAALAPGAVALAARREREEHEQEDDDDGDDDDQGGTHERLLLGRVAGVYPGRRGRIAPARAGWRGRDPRPHGGHPCRHWTSRPRWAGAGGRSSTATATRSA